VSIEDELMKDDDMLSPGSVGLAPGFLLTIVSELTQEVEPFGGSRSRDEVPVQSTFAMGP
jgi:hypothetical protein